jgi:hypothetical protein
MIIELPYTMTFKKKISLVKTLYMIIELPYTMTFKKKISLVKTLYHTLAIKYCIAIIAIYFAISTFYLMELWHFKICNYCNTFLRGFALYMIIELPYTMTFKKKISLVKTLYMIIESPYTMTFKKKISLV